MAEHITGIQLGKAIIEGKTKIVHELPEHPGEVILVSKDRISCHNGVRVNDMEGKAAISTSTAVSIFGLLEDAGIPTHFLRKHGDRGMICHNCEMIPIEWVTRRIATGSFLRRNPGVEEGYRFSPVKLEIFFKDDANDDPQWSFEQLKNAKLEAGGRVIGQHEIDLMKRMTVCIFEVLEKAWTSQDCSLIDMKIEFGISKKNGELILADIIDSDSWRLWPSGDKRLMKDKQVYRNMEVVTKESLDLVKRNFQWVADRVKNLNSKTNARAVILMGSASDMTHCEKIKNVLSKFGVPCEMRITSAHKGTEETLSILAEYEGSGIQTVFICVAGRSNGLGPVLSGNTCWPVINAPPVGPDWAAEDIWSSLRLPSGLGCSTCITPDSAALAAASILSLHDHMVWSRLRAAQLKNWVTLKKADYELQQNLIKSS